MWRRAKSRSLWSLRRFSSDVKPLIEDEGDWFYSSEWWGNSSDGHTILQSTSDNGNGVVSVVVYPSSMPEKVQWPRIEKWLNQRYREMYPGYEKSDTFHILGYQWRSLRFNDHTRQSTVKIMGTFRAADPSSVYFMQQPHCLAVPYLKSMVSAGMASLASSNYDLLNAVHGKKSMHILCIGHGGGSLPLFLASKIQGASIDIVEIDPLVISTSVQAMGFPSFSVMTKSGKRAHSKPELMDGVMWKGIHERLFLYEADAEEFIKNTSNIYDMVFIDAYDGDDIFPQKLWDPDSIFLKSLNDRLDPHHGTVIVNLHSGEDILNASGSTTTSSVFDHILPMGKYISGVSRAYMDVIVGNSSNRREGSGFGFTVSVPWLCNVSLVVCKSSSGMYGGNLTRDRVLNTLVSKSSDAEKHLNLPFSCVPYLKSGFVLVD